MTKFGMGRACFRRLATPLHLTNASRGLSATAELFAQDMSALTTDGPDRHHSVNHLASEVNGCSTILIVTPVIVSVEGPYVIAIASSDCRGTLPFSVDGVFIYGSNRQRSPRGLGVSICYSVVALQDHCFRSSRRHSAPAPGSS